MNPVSIKIIEYVNYIENHRDNVFTSWRLLQEPCKNMNFIYDDYLYERITENINNHDMSKYSEDEFIQYRKRFFPLTDAIKVQKDEVFEKAWEHHKEYNSHHWQRVGIDGQIEDVVEMVCDWMAMGMKFGDTAESYYLKNSDEIKLQDWQVSTIKEIFEAIKV